MEVDWLDCNRCSARKLSDAVGGQGFALWPRTRHQAANARKFPSMVFRVGPWTCGTGRMVGHRQGSGARELQDGGEVSSSVTRTTEAPPPWRHAGPGTGSWHPSAIISAKASTAAGRQNRSTLRRSSPLASARVGIGNEAAGAFGLLGLRKFFRMVSVSLSDLRHPAPTGSRKATPTSTV